MERFTISLDDSLAREFDALIQYRNYSTRSEAVRDILRRELESDRQTQDATLYCVANISYIFNHHERRLSERLSSMQHQSHELVVSSMHMHLSHDECMETLFLRGLASKIKQFANSLAAERGIRHCVVNLVSVQIDLADDRHIHTHPHY